MFVFKQNLKIDNHEIDFSDVPEAFVTIKDAAKGKYITVVLPENMTQKLFPGKTYSIEARSGAQHGPDFLTHTEIKERAELLYQRTVLQGGYGIVTLRFRVTPEVQALCNQ